MPKHPIKIKVALGWHDAGYQCDMTTNLYTDFLDIVEFCKKWGMKIELLVCTSKVLRRGDTIERCLKALDPEVMAENFLVVQKVKDETPNSD